MSLTRLTVLTLGPIMIVAAASWLAAPQSSRAMSHSQTSTASADPFPAGLDSRTLEARCQAAAVQLQQKLPKGFGLYVRAPFIMAGDVPKSRLQALHASVVAPVSRALAATYFDRSPQQPITIVLCATEVRFRQLARDWDGHLEGGYHGYYQRDKRRILLDLEAGNGSLAHELTHALSHADCEHLPEWFDEGLGALHEEATYAAKGKRLIGLPNWRCRLSQQAARNGQLPSLETWMSSTSFRDGDVGLRYALSRSMCLYLQERHLLIRYYKELRTRPDSDPEGVETLCSILEATSTTQVERQFTAWLKGR